MATPASTAGYGTLRAVEDRRPVPKSIPRENLMKTLQNDQDVISFILGQHQQIKALLQSVLATRGEARSRAFFDARRLMAVRETAEEELVHPAARRVLDGGEAIVRTRLAEEKQAKEVLAALEKLDVDSPSSSRSSRRSRATSSPMPNPRSATSSPPSPSASSPSSSPGCTRPPRSRMSFAPTRPHPGVESKAANLFAGSFAAMIDRARDALSSHSRR
jgi:hypothetical protein